MNADSLLHSLILSNNVCFISIKGLLKYDQSIYDQIMDLFDALPLSALVNNKFLCIHGGISPDIKNVFGFINHRLTILKKLIDLNKFLKVDLFAI
jgi:hypothetical protein